MLTPLQYLTYAVDGSPPTPDSREPRMATDTTTQSFTPTDDEVLAIVSSARYAADRRLEDKAAQIEDATSIGALGEWLSEVAALMIGAAERRPVTLPREVWTNLEEEAVIDDDEIAERASWTVNGLEGALAERRGARSILARMDRRERAPAREFVERAERAGVSGAPAWGGVVLQLVPPLS